MTIFVKLQFIVPILFIGIGYYLDLKQNPNQFK